VNAIIPDGFALSLINVPGDLQQLFTGNSAVTINNGGTMIFKGTAAGPRGGTGGLTFTAGINWQNGGGVLSADGNFGAPSVHFDNTGTITQNGGLFDIATFRLPPQNNATTFDFAGFAFAAAKPTVIGDVNDNTLPNFTFSGTPVFLAGHRPNWILTCGSATGTDAVWDLNGFTMVGDTIRVLGGGFQVTRYATLKNELGAGAGPGGVIDANRLEVGGFNGITYTAPYLNFVDPVTVTLRGSNTIYNNFSINNDGTGKPAPFTATNSTLILDPAAGSASIDTGSKDLNSTDFDPADWDDNFAWDLVKIGDGDTITLTGDANVGAGNNALYARTMECVGSSGTIDLNGHNVYLLEAPTCVTFDDSGGGAAYWPEVPPSGAVLIVR
jgi:hypothetical protein